jgi:hypothetical protein
MWLSHSSGCHWIGRKIIVACALGSLLLTSSGNPACAPEDTRYTFEALHPEFLKTHIPDYAQFEIAKSPATYEPGNGDFRSEFVSPNGTPVSIVVKAPVVSREYDVPSRLPNETVYDYLNGALYDANNQPRSKAIIKLPKDIYNVDFPLYSNCTSTTDYQPKYVHWQLPQGASDLVIDGQGSTINFSDFCLGLVLPNAQRVTLKNFTFAWPKITIASVGTITAVGGNGTTGYTYDVNIATLRAPLPKMIAATTSWDTKAGHWDLKAEYDDVSYGDGVSSGSGVPFDAGRRAGWRLHGQIRPELRGSVQGRRDGCSALLRLRPRDHGFRQRRHAGPYHTRQSDRFRLFVQPGPRPARHPSRAEADGRAADFCRRRRLAHHQCGRRCRD